MSWAILHHLSDAQARAIIEGIEPIVPLAGAPRKKGTIQGVMLVLGKAGLRVQAEESGNRNYQIKVTLEAKDFDGFGRLVVGIGYSHDFRTALLTAAVNCSNYLRGKLGP